MAVEEGLLVAEIDIRPELLAPNGYLHAATVIALADNGQRLWLHCAPAERRREFHDGRAQCNFLGTARDGTIACIAKAVHLGKTTQVWDASVSRHGDGKPIALFRCTQMVLWPKTA
jgi:uncharacterized protein (TIGR00369 family)